MSTRGVGEGRGGGKRTKCGSRGRMTHCHQERKGAQEGERWGRRVSGEENRVDTTSRKDGTIPRGEGRKAGVSRERTEKRKKKRGHRRKRVRKEAKEVER